MRRMLLRVKVPWHRKITGVRGAREAGWSLHRQSIESTNQL